MYLLVVSTYENVRHTLEKNNVTNTKVKAFVGGCCASVVGQTIIVPFDVIAQHIMLIGLAEKRTGETHANTHSRLSQFVKGSMTVNKGHSNGKDVQNLNKTGNAISYNFFRILLKVL
jgi:hypothetical protein